MHLREQLVECCYLKAERPEIEPLSHESNAITVILPSRSKSSKGSLYLIAKE